MHAAEQPQIDPQDSFAAIAVELNVAKAHFGELSFAAAILSMMRADNIYKLERLAAECGITPAVAQSIILDEKRFASLIAEAHRKFKAMIPFEDEIRKLMERANGGK